MRKRREVTVDFPRRLREAFRREARRLFPAEAYAVILGERDGSIYRASMLFFPERNKSELRCSSVPVRVAWWDDAERTAADHGLKIIGDIHSHPFRTAAGLSDSSPSQADWDRFDHEYIQSVCTVAKDAGGRLHTRLRHWAATPKVTVITN